jgi:hypothetical protein
MRVPPSVDASESRASPTRFVSAAVRFRWWIIAPTTAAPLSRETLRLITEVAALQARLERLRTELRRLVDDAEG